MTSLDEVYLHHAGRRYSDATRRDGGGRAMTTTTTTTIDREMTTAGPGRRVALRHVVPDRPPSSAPWSASPTSSRSAWSSRPSGCFSSAALFQKVIDIPGFAYHGSYLAYLIPGVVAMNAMSGNMWAGMSMIEEIDRGTLNRFLVTPASRLAIMNASVAEQAVSTSVQTLIIVGPRLRGGRPLPGRRRRHRGPDRRVDPGRRPVGRAVEHDRHAAALREAIIGVYTFFMLPLMFLSSAFIPPAFMPGWMQAIASRNPLNWEVQIGRDALAASTDWSAVAVRSGGLLSWPCSRWQSPSPPSAPTPRTSNPDLPPRRYVITAGATLVPAAGGQVGYRKGQPDGLFQLQDGAMDGMQPIGSGRGVEVELADLPDVVLLVKHDDQIERNSGRRILGPLVHQVFPGGGR